MTTAACKAMLLKNLRNIMKNTTYVNQALQAYIIPSNDAHQSEYIAACDKRKEFISGFTGSYGTLVVTSDLAALWTDGRYFLQAEKQLSSDWILMKEGISGTPTLGDWLATVLPAESRVGMDPFLMSFSTCRTLKKKLESSGLSLIPVDQNLVDVIWKEKPFPPNVPVTTLSIKYTGESWQDKIKNVRDDMRKKNASVLVLTALDEIAWLFNLRGNDIEYNPVFFAYAVITTDDVHLFIAQEKLTETIKRELQNSDGLKLHVHEYGDIRSFLSSINSTLEKRIWISEDSSFALVSLFPEEYRVSDANPVLLRKAVKNKQEIQGMQNAHIKDAVALCQLFCWLEENIKLGNITEISAASKLEDFRKSQMDFMGPSFATISCSGPNGSVIHYHPEESTNRVILPDQLYLCDSGGQYRDGTTDVTRTWHFGVPTAYERECYTRVLKGFISLSSAQFPRFIKGQMLDTLARKSLWDSGLDYMHGTGHGVGMYLNVHEGPMGISWRPYHHDPGLSEGMILSIEPGYYEDDKFGIRIENLAVIVKANPKYNYKNKSFVTFEPLTLVPIQTKMIDPSLMTPEEVSWLNDYHSKCRDVVGSALLEQGKTAANQWLLKETVHLG